MAASSVKKPAREIGSLTKGYLLLYNLVQFLGWSYLLVLMATYSINRPQGSTLWEAVKPVLIVFQNAAVLEILHTAIKIVPSSVFLTGFQVMSRVVMLCGVLIPFSDSQKSIGLPLLLFAWTVTEIIRYLYYVLNLVGNVPYLLIWCRYTFFIVLYPIGVSGELLCAYASLPYVSRNKPFTIEMPNLFNVTFSYYYALIFMMLMYIPVFPQLYLYMVGQRKKIIGQGSVKKTQ